MKLLDPFDSNMKLLAKVLDLRSAKQNVIATNIANAETPGFAKKEFLFEDELKQAIHAKPGTLATTHSNHIAITPENISSVSGNIRDVKDKTGIGDENGVSVDMEMMDLAENELLYETAAQLLKKKFSMLSYVVQEGK
ncbi:MAG TPA: flagellar basal body rod protein FlgB [Desulfobacterales bacterium]|nr:flagellar basal body rod protein FlgB [Desulfobacterales bacterium]HIP39840.1 flagellar basal body rod protein FlgB [Desulfocapsa sulfexigens]